MLIFCFLQGINIHITQLVQKKFYSIVIFFTYIMHF